MDTRRYSRLVVDGLKQTPSRAMLRAVGFVDADFGKPQVGVASTWSNLTPCNMHIDELAKVAASGIEGAGAKAVTFNTITVSDGIANGTPGIRRSGPGAASAPRRMRCAACIATWSSGTAPPIDVALG